MKKRIIILFVTIFLNNVVFALENSLFDLSELGVQNVVSASRINQSMLQAPSAVTIIDKNMIEISGFNELIDLLRLVPGFQVGHFDSRLFTASYHGFGWEWMSNVQVLVDGRSIYSAALSQVDWDGIGVQLSDIERLEVVRGPSASAYGSNSFVAAINIVTKSPSVEGRGGVELSFSSHGDRRKSLKFSGKNKITDYVFSYKGIVDEGELATDADKQYEYKAHRDLDSFNLRNKFNINSQHQINTAVTLTKGDTSPYPLDELIPSDRKVVDKSLHVKWSYVDNDRELKASVYRNSQKSDDIRSSYNLNTYPFPEPIKSIIAELSDPYIRFGHQDMSAHRTDFELQYNHLGKKNNIVVGGGWRDDRIKSFSHLKNKGTKSEQTFRFFINDQFEVNQYLTVNTGVIYERSNRNQNNISPRLSFNFNFHDNNSIRLAYSKAYRIPSLLENNIDSAVFLENDQRLNRILESDGDLNPPVIKSMDLGYIGKLSSFPLSWNLKLYKDEINNNINYVTYRGILDFNRKVTKVINDGVYNAYGLEGSVTYRSSLNNMLRFTFNRGHSKSKRLVQLNPTIIENSTSYMPKESYGLLIGHQFDQYWNFNAGIYHTGFLTWAGNGEKIPNYTRYDVSVAKDFVFNKSTLNIKLAAQRLGGEHMEFNDEFEFDKEAYIRFKWSYNK